MEITADHIFHETYYYSVLQNINNDKVINECNKFKNNNTSRKRSNEGGWQSYDLNYNNLKDNGYNETVKLIDTIDNILTSIVQELNVKPLVIDNMWININSKHNFNWSHCHPGSVLSGTFYVDVPEDSNSNFIFEQDKNVSMSNYSEWIKKTDIFDLEWKIEPCNNLLLLFPSYLTHKVTPNLSDKERISIAFNTIIQS